MGTAFALLCRRWHRLRRPGDRGYHPGAIGVIGPGCDIFGPWREHACSSTFVSCEGVNATH